MGPRKHERRVWRVFGEQEFSYRSLGWVALGVQGKYEKRQPAESCDVLVRTTALYFGTVIWKEPGKEACVCCLSQTAAELLYWFFCLPCRQNTVKAVGLMAVASLWWPAAVSWKDPGIQFVSAGDKMFSATTANYRHLEISEAAGVICLNDTLKAACILGAFCSCSGLL